MLYIQDRDTTALPEELGSVDAEALVAGQTAGSTMEWRSTVMDIPLELAESDSKNPTNATGEERAKGPKPGSWKRYYMLVFGAT